MKNLITIALLVLTLTMSAQIAPKTPNVTTDANGNYKELVDIKLSKTYTTADGKVLDVFQNAKGKLYVITGVSEKTGKPKKKYLVTK